MIHNQLIKLIIVILFPLVMLPTVSGNIQYFDPNGKIIEPPRYQQLVQDREPEINQLNQEGYGNKTMKLQDPILLRKKRIEEWEKRRKSQP